MSFSFTKPERQQHEMGAEFTGEGTHFAIFSQNAEAIELCLFSDDGAEEVARLEMPSREGSIFSGYIHGIRPGQLYGYRAHGPYEPEQGHRFNPNKLLLDPYAREIAGTLQWDDALWGYDLSTGDDLTFDARDSAAFMVKGVVQDPAFDWAGDKTISRLWSDSVVYEAHVRGLTMLHPGVPDELRGTYAGMVSDPILEHLQKLGVTAIELLPCQFFLDDRMLLDKGLSNYWGYQTLGYFAPEPRYLGPQRGHSPAISQFKDMVKRFHQVGIEVIMDVVYNHTAEGSERGPTLSFRGIDNASYYALSPENPRYSFDTTGTGNTLSVAHPMVLRMVLDSLRYWVQVMHVDGFRFDLASTLGREAMGFDREGGFFDAIRQDPILAGVKLIAEPWDIGSGGYQVGGFPHPFREWNDKFRDTVRGFWRGDEGVVGDLANNLIGSPQQFNHSDRGATSSINFLAAHDGFTLADTVSYNERHNEANGEGGADGHSNNLSDNMGAEGAVDDAGDDEGIAEARQQRIRAMLATLLLSQGVPMILSGDELGNSQQGNNNVYCQDNETAWVDWPGKDDALFDFCAKLIAMRHQHYVLAQDNFLRGDPGEDGRVEIAWHQPDGRAMDAELWAQPQLKVLGLFLSYSAQEAFVEGERPLFIVLNAGDEVTFTLPTHGELTSWHRLLDTAREDAFAPEQVGEAAVVAAASVCVFAPD
ncbi:glycogen debranching protein GlgX [Novosphingobium sp. Rr 2-17]|uniref:glycogen debranching protein GlgX n=1 Tax=Novosphingobium sp. Rr 2-17 TaxID=555793 RepID=UPI0005BA0D99|nr:glycogen debranching protein GlgX [Novosphingobium sp. Rr 2-17]